MKKWGVILAAALAALPWAAEANQIRSVIAVDFLTVEVVMAEPLTETELDPIRWDPMKPDFVFSDGVEMMGAPVPQDVRGYPNTYRIPRFPIRGRKRLLSRPMTSRKWRTATRSGTAIISEKGRSSGRLFPRLPQGTVSEAFMI